MKKVALGCLGVLVVLVVAVAVAGYVFLVRPAREYVASFTQLAEVSEPNDRIANRAEFKRPPAGELTADMVQRFAHVQEAMATRLGARFEQLKVKYDEIDHQMRDEAREARLGEILDAYKDLASVIVEAKSAQVDALNQAKFSLAEYEWVREKVYQAAGLAAMRVDVTEMRQGLLQGNPKAGRKPIETDFDVPEINKELVKHYLDKLQDWVPLAWLGL